MKTLPFQQKNPPKKPNCRIVMSFNTRYFLGNKLFVKRSQYIRIKNPFRKESEKAGMYF